MTTKAKKTPDDIRREMTDKIVAAIKAGTPPWRQPWSYNPNGGSPRNFDSKRRYSGVNPMILILTGMIKGYDSQQWGTGFSWTNRLGVHIKKGEEATTVVLLAQIPVKDKATGKVELTATGKPKTFPLLREYAVFNAYQMTAPAPAILLGVPYPRGIVRTMLGDAYTGTGKRTEPTTEEELRTIAAKFLPAAKQPAATASREEMANAISVGIAERLKSYQTAVEVRNTEPDFEPAEAFLKAVLAGTKTKLVHKGAKASYEYPPTDRINLPPKPLFDSMADYYQTAMHEVMHSVEPEGRVGKREGDQYDYAFRELVAEIGACYLLLELGVPRSEKMIPQSQSYLAHWLDRMGGDPKYVFDAATQASKAVEYLLAFVGKQNPAYESTYTPKPKAAKPKAVKKTPTKKKPAKRAA